MGDMGDDFRAYHEEKKEQRRRNLEAFDPAGWTEHTPYHFSRSLMGMRLDYWPSKKKWMYDGKKGHGDVDEFIQARERSGERPTISARAEVPAVSDGVGLPAGEPDDVGTGKASIYDTDPRLQHLVPGDGDA